MVMKFVCLAFLCALSGAAASGHPIEKVIGLLDGLKVKALAQGKEELNLYNKFSYWCKTSITDLKGAIADEKASIEQLKDLLSGKDKEKEVLEEQIDALGEQIAKLQAAAAKALKIRDEEKATYGEVMDDVRATIEAVRVALDAVSKAGAETESLLEAKTAVRKVLSFLSVSSSTTEVQLSTLQAFAQRPKQLAEGDRDKHVDVYKFKGGGVIELLKGLMEKFEGDKLQATKEETNAQNAYDLAKQAADRAEGAAKDSKQEKEGILGNVVNQISDAEANLDETENDLAADSKARDDTNQQCTTKADEWKQRSTTREQEIEAIEMAKKILAKATGVRTEAPGNPIPPAAPVFMQIVSNDNNPKMAAVQVIREAAQKTHSRALERLAMEVSAHLSGPFDAVNNMVEKMIFRLMDEQKQEDEHKHWCDQELEKTNTMKDHKDDKIEDLTAEINKQTATVGKLKEDIAAADELVEKLVAFKAEATEIRKIGKQENKEAVKDSETAQKALADAIAVLESFYKESGAIPKEPWEFLQAPVKLPKNPATWDSGYDKVSDPTAQPGGIVTVLEKVMTDFAKVEADTKSQEEIDQKEYEQSMSDSDIEMSRRRKESEMKENEKKRRSEKIAAAQSKKKDTVAELEKTEQYLTDLKPACVDGDSSYGERKAARSKEITALKKAQEILLQAFDDKGGKFLEIRRHA